VTDTPTLFLLVGLPGTGKTTVSRALEGERGALRLSPNEWMLPLFGDSDPDGPRDVLEGRLLCVSHRALHGGLDVVVDLGLWGREERAALADLARHTGAHCEVRHCHVEEEERRARIDRRWAESPSTTFSMTEDDHAGNLGSSRPQTTTSWPGSTLRGRRRRTSAGPHGRPNVGPRCPPGTGRRTRVRSRPVPP